LEDHELHLGGREIPRLEIEPSQLEEGLQAVGGQQPPDAHEAAIRLEQELVKPDLLPGGPSARWR